ncbi:MAG: P-loop NTPase [Spirochaetota bacterium]|jgi:flagellar biosynthesis protein FlhG|nr:P-loop NTPase [Spirochaetota bacterium]
MENKPVIIPVASGKGGVGKTFVSVNLAYALANLGKKVILMDLDFGGANIHTCMGYSVAPDGIGNFLNQRNSKLSDYILSTSNKNLSFISGDAEMVGIANITAAQKKKLTNQLFHLNADYIVLDLGAGSSYNTVDFFILSSCGILVAMPELTSIFNAYSLLKTSVFRRLFLEFKSIPEMKDLFNEQIKKGGENAWKVSELLQMIKKVSPSTYLKAIYFVNEMSPKLIINMATSPADLEMGEKIRKISNSFLNVDLEYLGFLYRDKKVHESINKRQPLAVSDTANSTYQSIAKIAYKIVSLNKLQKSSRNFDDYEEIMDEITEDLPSKISGYSELADENLISINDLIALVTNQEYENLMLKKEIESLKKQLLQFGKKV